MTSNNIATTASIKASNQNMFDARYCIQPIIVSLDTLYSQRVQIEEKIVDAADDAQVAMADRDYTFAAYLTERRVTLAALQQDIDTAIALLSREGAKPRDEYLLILVRDRQTQLTISARLAACATLPSFLDYLLDQ